MAFLTRIFCLIGKKSARQDYNFLDDSGGPKKLTLGPCPRHYIITFITRSFGDFVLWILKCGICNTYYILFEVLHNDVKRAFFSDFQGQPPERQKGAFWYTNIESFRRSMCCARQGCVYTQPLRPSIHSIYRVVRYYRHV